MNLNDKLSLASLLFGKEKTPQTSTVQAKALGASEDGNLLVQIGEEEYDEDGNIIVPASDLQMEIPIIGAASEDEEITVLVSDGQPTGIAGAGWGDRVQTTATNAETAAQQAQELAESVTAHFWDDTNGAHVTSYPQEDEATANGAEVLISATPTTSGMLLRRVVNGVKKLLASFTADENTGSIAFYNGADNPQVLGQFGSDGLQIYSDDENHTELSHLGYGWGYNSAGELEKNPYYSLGKRIGDIGNYSIAEGYNVTASGFASYAEGYGTTASGDYSHAEGHGTTASGTTSHAENLSTTASGTTSHAEGWMTTASEFYSHAEGSRTIASGEAAHAEGWSTRSNGLYSHAEGAYTYAQGTGAHSEGNYTNALGDYQHAAGKYNVSDLTGTYARITGNGTDNDSRSNAEALDWEGNLRLAGDVWVACDDDSTGGRNLANVGMYYSSNPSGSYSLANATTAQVGASVTVPAGRYMLTFALDFASNATGRRYVDIYNSTTGEVIQRSIIRTPPVSGAATSVNGCIFIEPTQETTYPLRAYQNSGGALNISNRSIYAIRLR